MRSSNLLARTIRPTHILPTRNDDGSISRARTTRPTHTLFKRPTTVQIHPRYIAAAIMGTATQRTPREGDLHHHYHMHSQMGKASSNDEGRPACLSLRLYEAPNAVPRKESL